MRRNLPGSGDIIQIHRKLRQGYRICGVWVFGPRFCLIVRHNDADVVSDAALWILGNLPQKISKPQPCRRIPQCDDHESCRECVFAIKIMSGEFLERDFCVSEL